MDLIKKIKKNNERNTVPVKIYPTTHKILKALSKELNDPCLGDTTTRLLENFNKFREIDKQ